MRSTQDTPRPESEGAGPGYQTGPSAADGLPAAVCELAASLLPRSDRARYAEEWRADLQAIDRAQRAGFAWSVLSHAIPLRLTLAGRLHQERPLLCQLGRHHDVRVHDNPENMRFTSHRCDRCGRVKDSWRGPPSAADSYAWGAAAGGLH